VNVAMPNAPQDAHGCTGGRVPAVNSRFAAGAGAPGGLSLNVLRDSSPVSRAALRLRTSWWVGLLCTLLATVPGLRFGHTAPRMTAEVPAPTQGTPQVLPHLTQERSSAERGRLQERANPRPGTIHLNFRNVDILQVINVISELTGKNFLVDNKVRGPVTLIAPTPVTPEEAYQVFLSMLEMQGFTAVPQGPIVKIIPAQDAKDHPLPIMPHRPRPPQ
jgi:hypothetical protein